MPGMRTSSNRQPVWSTPARRSTAWPAVGDGIMKDAIAIEHGYRHWELGAREHLIDCTPLPSNPALATGLCLEPA